MKRVKKSRLFFFLISYFKIVVHLNFNNYLFLLLLPILIKQATFLRSRHLRKYCFILSNEKTPELLERVNTYINICNIKSMFTFDPCWFTTCTYNIYRNIEQIHALLSFNIYHYLPFFSTFTTNIFMHLHVEQSNKEIKSHLKRCNRDTIWVRIVKKKF